MKVTTMEGATQYVSQGPTAAIVPIKQLGTNGGGYFGVNSSHPLENPTYLPIWWNVGLSLSYLWRWHLHSVSI